MQRSIYSQLIVTSRKYLCMPIARKLHQTEVESVYSAANSAVWYSHHFAALRAKAAAHEEDYVATLVTDAVPLLAQRWASVLSPKGIALRVSGVFCHGHPQVAFGSPRSQVELADLLIVHQHRSKTHASARAMLIQAKMSADARHRLPGNDSQLVLFSTWPKFEFVTGSLARGLRDLNETGKGSRYALVLDSPAYPEAISWADQCPWGACTANQVLSAERSFAKLLGNMLLGKDGRPVQLPTPKDEWSRTIKELLTVTGAKTYRRKNIGRGNTPRLTSAPPGVMFLAESPGFTQSATRRSRRSVSDTFFATVPPAQAEGLDSEPPESVRAASPDGGMSTLLIETREID